MFEAEPGSASADRSRRAVLGRYAAVVLLVPVASEILWRTPLEEGWQGLATLGVALICAWWAGIGPSVCIPPLLYLVARFHADDIRESVWPTLGEVVVFAIVSLMVLSTAAAGQYRRHIHAITREHSQKLRNHSRALNRAYIIFRDLDGRITEWSDGAQSLFGWSRDEATGRNIHHLLRSEFQQSLGEISEEFLRTGEWQGEVLHTHKNGEVLHIATHWILYRDSTGIPIGVAEVHNDVTDLRRAEAAVREADRRKEEFLATLAHELRNPLAPISNSLQIIRLSDELSPSLQHVREIMEQQVGQMIRLVEDLLEVSRVTRGRITLRREQTLVAELVADAVNTVRCQFDELEVGLSVSVPTEPIALDADPVRMGQVLVNLLGNAAKYNNPGGHVWLSASRAEGELLITVRDTGIGIPPSMLDEIFEMFAQVDRTLTRASGGLGIGLTLVKNLVELHGGSVAAASEGPGFGSEFAVRLPLHVDLSNRGMSSTPTPSPYVSEAPTRQVLVVDDTRAVGFVLCKLIEKLGHSVRFAGDGQEALRLIATKRPDIVFSDVAMPGMDGYELARRIRSERGFDDVLLVAITGFGQPSDRAKALEAGFDHHMIKPAGLEDLRNVLSTEPLARAARRCSHHAARES